LGYRKGEIINRKIWDIFPKEEADKRFAMVRKVFQTGQTGTIEANIPLSAREASLLNVQAGWG
jgi:hypothetical protein